MKIYKRSQNIGKAKYVVSHHDGVKKHTDGSPFFDIFITTNKKQLNTFVQGLRDSGFVEK